MNKTILSLLLLLGTVVAANAQQKSKVWSPDNGDGTYRNPIINADYSDPDVIAVGNDYYLTASSFNCMPGLPILHSRDLVNWEIIGHALTRQFADSITTQHGMGVWAPSIRYHDGQFYIYWGDPDRGVFMVKTSNPAGKWDDPVLVIEGKGMIDTSPLWDDDGHCYLVNAWANSRAGFNSVLSVRELSADGTRPVGNPVIVFEGNKTGNHTVEGPKFYKREGWYWILCPAGGVEKGWQLAMRSRSPYGPYEWKQVLHEGKSGMNGPHQGGWIHTSYGEDWFIHFQDREAYGRVCHLQPVDWSSGWPIMGDKGEPVWTYRKPMSESSIIVNPQEDDEFNTPQLGLQWQWQSDYRQEFGQTTSMGYMRLYTYRLSNYSPNPLNASLWPMPSMLLQKTPAERFTATAKIDFTAANNNQYAGIICMSMSYSAICVQRIGEEFHLQLRSNAKASEDGSFDTITDIITLKPTSVDPASGGNPTTLHIDNLYLRMQIANSKVSYSYSLDGKKWSPTSVSFSMSPGKWIGSKIGFFAADTNAKGRLGWLDADWFHVTE